MVANVDADGRSHQIFEAQALTKCSLGLLNREHMTSLLRKLDHERVIQLLGNLNATWSAVFERYAGFIGLSFRERLEMVFKDLGARFGVEDRRGTLIILELSQDDLAEMIGSSRPMVSKLVGDMVEEGVLAHSEQRHFILPSQAERQSKLASSFDDVRSDRPVRGSISCTMAVGLSDASARRSLAGRRRFSDESFSNMRLCLKAGATHRPHRVPGENQSMRPLRCLQHRFHSI